MLFWRAVAFAPQQVQQQQKLFQVCNMNMITPCILEDGGTRTHFSAFSLGSVHHGSTDKCVGTSQEEMSAVYFSRLVYFISVHRM